MDFSLRSRVVFGLATVSLVLVAVSATVIGTIQNEMIAQVDRRLDTFAPAFAPRPGLEPPRAEDLLPQTPGSVPADDRFGERISDVYQGFITPDGQQITLFAPNVNDVSTPAPVLNREPDALTVREILTVEAEDGTTYRVLLEPFDDAIAITGVPIDDVNETIDRLVTVVLVGSGAILVGLAMVGWWVIRLGIRPIQTMTRAARRIADGELDIEIEEPRTQTESGELASSLNRMLTRLREALDQREQSERRLRRFVADASHELRTPTQTIRGYAEMYRIGALNTQHDLDDAMRRTEQEAQRMGRLVDDMLKLARFDEERPLTFTVVDLNQLACDAARDAAAAHPDREVVLEAGQSVWVRADEDILRQVVANLVGNALAHTNGPVEVVCSATTALATLTVTDEGPGLSPEEVARITERFYRTDPSRSRAQGGSGLGLAIVESAIQAHDGELEINSDREQGTNVKIELPTVHHEREPTARPSS